MKLGYASPAKMLGEMRPSELGMWAALYSVDPWDEERADYRAGIVASTIANVNLRRGAEPLSPHDFMPFGKQRKEESLASRLKGFLISKTIGKVK